MMNIDSKYSLDLYCQSYWDYYLAIEERFFTRSDIVLFPSETVTHFLLNI